MRLYAIEISAFFLRPHDPGGVGGRISGHHSATGKDFEMDQLPIILCLGTLGFAAAFGYISARATEKQMRDGSHRKSALSRDGAEERLRRAAVDGR
jgi:hypothetical protein